MHCLVTTTVPDRALKGVCTGYKGDGRIKWARLQVRHLQVCLVALESLSQC